MRYVLFGLLLIANVAQAYEIDPATGFIVGSVPEHVERYIDRSQTQTREHGSVYMPYNSGSSQYTASSTGTRQYVMPSGSYLVSRVGSTTYVTRASRAK